MWLSPLPYSVVPSVLSAVMRFLVVGRCLPFPLAASAKADLLSGKVAMLFAQKKCPQLHIDIAEKMTPKVDWDWWLGGMVREQWRWLSANLFLTDRVGENNVFGKRGSGPRRAR